MFRPNGFEDLHSKRDGETVAAIPNQPSQSFNLRRRFAITSLAVILGIALGLGWLLSSMLTERMLRREGQVSMEFIRNLLSTDKSGGFLADPSNRELKARFLDSMTHLSSMTEPVLAKAYGRDGHVVWSSDPELAGQEQEADNDELSEALKGELVVHSGTLGDLSHQKQEHAGLAAKTNYYVESYIPVVEPGGKVLGVVELYKVPLQLNASIREALIELWLACAASAVVMFVGLNGVVGRADKIMREQQARLAESQELSSAVELAGAVAHNLRNPLASIRASAEMLGFAVSEHPECAEHCEDITASVDRANRWITELVRVSNVPQLTLESVATAPMWRDCLEELQPEMDRSRVTWELQRGEPPEVIAHPAMLRQVLLSVLANAIEAMPQGGPVRIGWAEGDKQMRMSVIDAGTGINEETKRALFRPFFSTKSGGLGIGLALARRTLEQWNGSIDLASEPGGGSRLTISLPVSIAPQTRTIASQEVSNGAVAGH
jgi:two-component system sensor histidine kinase HydH